MSMVVRKRRPTASAARQAKLARLAAMLDVASAPRMPVSRRRYGLVPEMKHFDTSFAFTVPGGADWTGTEVACSNYIQSDGTTVGAYTDSALIPSAVGAGYGQIQGSKYLLRGVSVRGEIIFGAVSDADDMYGMKSVRLVLVQDTMPQGAQAQGESVFPDMGTAPQCNYSYLALGSGTGGRFRILADRVFTHDNIVAGTDNTNKNSLGFQGKTFRFDWRPSRPVQVNIKANSSTPTVAALSDCNIFLLAHASGATPTVTLNGAARCSYQD